MIFQVASAATRGKTRLAFGSAKWSAQVKDERFESRNPAPACRVRPSGAIVVNLAT